MTGSLIWLAICGWLNRWRGAGTGFWNPLEIPHTLQRIVISFVLAAPAMIVSPWHGLAIAISTLVLGFSMGWGSYFDFGTGRHGDDVEWIDALWHRWKGSDARKDFISLSLRGLQFTVPPCLIAATINPTVLVLAPLGLLMGPVYLWFHRKGMGIEPAEIVWGALLGAIMFDISLFMYL